MAPTIEAQVADLVGLIVRRTEERVEAAFASAIDAELARRNGGVANAAPVEESIPEPEPTTKTCRRCGETKPLAAFPSGRPT